jgi:hypothetical protein
MTRPLGASLGDFLSQPHAHGGLALGPTITTILMTTGIIFSVSYLALSRQDVVKDSVAEEKTDEKKSKGALGQLIAVIVIVLILSVGGYYVRQGQLQAETAPTATVGSSQEAGASQSPLGDLSTFSNLGQAILTAINAGDWATANSKVNDLEYAWDNADARLKPMNPKAWTHIDGALDKVFREVRAVHPNQQTAAAALQTLLTTIANP